MRPSTSIESPRSTVSAEIVPAGDLVRRYRETAQVIRWPIPADLEQALEVTLRNGYAEHLAERPVEEVCVRHAGCSLPGMIETVRLAEEHALTAPLQGIGAELGAGCGVLSAVIARSPKVQAVLALEVCAPQVELLVPKVARHVLGSGHAAKVIPVVGSFDDLRIPDGALDFVIEYHSLHHSGNLPRTMRECARVLKRGGRALLVDKVRPDSMTDAEVEALLSQVYSREFLISCHYPPDLKMTRLMNGEHEYRQREWEAAFAGAGLVIERQVKLHARVPVSKAVKGMLSLTPAAVRRRFYQSDDATPRSTWEYLAQWGSRLTSPKKVFGPRHETIIVLRKPD